MTASACNRLPRARISDHKVVLSANLRSSALSVASISQKPRTKLFTDCESSLIYTFAIHIVRPIRQNGQSRYVPFSSLPRHARDLERDRLLQSMTGSNAVEVSSAKVALTNPQCLSLGSDRLIRPPNCSRFDSR
jgi:hypothetical protein